VYIEGNQEGIQAQFFTPPLLPCFLALAEVFRRFGADYNPPGSQTPFLDPAATWRCPDNLQLPGFPLEVPLLSEEIAKLYDDAQEGNRQRQQNFKEAKNKANTTLKKEYLTAQLNLPRAIKKNDGPGM
jgi:hypothetical protein